MTTPTAYDIETRFYHLLKASALAAAVNGSVYRNNMRPRDSRKEDIVIVPTAITAIPPQTGMVTIHILVPDIQPYDDGASYPDSQRLDQLARTAQDWIDSLPPVIPQSLHLVQQTAVTPIAFPSIQHHALSIPIRFTFYDTNE